MASSSQMPFMRLTSSDSSRVLRPNVLATGSLAVEL